MPKLIKGVVFFQGNDGQFYFKIVAKNGQTLVTSEGYKRRWSAWYGALATKRTMQQSD